LAVGAPYEKNGVVYIYLGSSSGIKREASQIIEAGDLPSPLEIKTFGYSLSGVFSSMLSYYSISH